MLQTIRERAQGLVAAVIVTLLILTFAVWGIESYLNEARRVVVATVDGEEIELAAYQESYQRMRQRAQAELGDAFDPRMWAEDSIKLKALDFLVDERLLTQSINRARMRISDAQVSEYLRASPNFQVEGKFSGERYAQVTSMLGFSEQTFESQTRNDLALQQLRAGVAASTFVTVGEAQRALQLREQKRTIGYTVIAPNEPSTESVSATDIADYYEKHKEEYRVEEKVALEFLELKLDDLKSDVTVNEDALNAYYDSHKADFTVEEQRNANHILIKVKPDATPTDAEKAKQKALKLREQVIAGADFETLAKENSDDIGSRSEGGETGLFGRGVMAPEFEQAAFKLKVDEVSEPIKTAFGFHIIKLKAIAPSGTKSYSEVKSEIESKFRAEQAENLYFDAAERFSDAVYEHPDSLVEGADTLGLTIQTAIAQSRQEIAAQFSEAVADAAWEPEVLLEGLASAPLEIGSDRIVAIRVTQHEASKVPALDQIKDALTAEIQTQRVRAAAKARGDGIIERLRKGEDRATVLSAEKLEWEEHLQIDREDSAVNRAVSRAGFKVPVKKNDAPVYLGIELGTGGFAVMGVSDPRDTELATLDAVATKELRRGNERLRAAGDWLDFVAALRANVEVETHPENL
ncbi:MAG: hypothetical protein EXR86_14070 [Gammaproteobacteria bacterium]|nr:hypothetical protein [Gammaproteobacteria bacterium]